MQQELEKIIKEFSFEETGSIKKDYKNNIFVLIGKINGRNSLLKIASKKNSYRIDQFKKEKMVDDILEKHNRDLKKPLVVKTDILGFGENDKFVWIIRKYYPGLSLAAYRPEKVLWGYDVIRSNFLFFRSKIINKIVNNLLSLYTLETDLRKLAISHDDLPQRYKKNIEDYNVKEIEDELGINLEKQIKFYNVVKKDYFSKENIGASVGDLSPSNIIIKNDDELVFSDFELFCFDNYTADIAYLYLFFWRYRAWQKALVDLTIKNDKDRNFFRASIIKETMFLYFWPYFTLKNKKNIGHKEFNRKHIWRKYLEAAGESFDAIMKVK
jgi:serine/threonine protein kinase